MYSGKTTACRFLESLGAYLLYSDKIVHHLLDHNVSCQKELSRLLGPDIIIDNKCDRAKVAEKIFSNEKLLEATEQIIHPLLLAEIKRRYESIKRETRYGLFCVEMPLVQEIGADKDFDTVIAINAGPETIRARMRAAASNKEAFEKRENEYKKRMRRQFSPQEKAAKADIIINNDGSTSALKKNVTDVFTQLTIPLK